MDTPQEVQVWFILPAVRKNFVTVFKKKGLSQKKIARIMNITEPAVSQYLKNKRGKDVVFSKKLVNEINSSAEHVLKKEHSFRSELQRIMKLIKDTMEICTVCHDHIDTTEDCRICYT